MLNLKKLIASVSAVALVLTSVATTAFAGSYTDVAEDSAYYEAVEALGKLGVVEGFEDGSYKPEEEVTRAQMAAFIARIQGFGETAKATANTQFEDVTSSHWASGYIAQAANQGIVNGYGNGKFGPDDKVTYEQAVKMIMCTLGYEPFATNNGGYPTGYLTAATRYGVADGVSNAVVGTNANRGTIAQLLNNAIDTPIMAQSKWNTDGTVEYEIYDGKTNVYKTLMSENLSTVKLRGVVVENSYVSFTNGNKTIATDKDAEVGILLTSSYDTNNKTFAYSETYSNGVNNGYYGEIRANVTRYFLAGDTDAEAYLGQSVIFYVKETSNSKWEIQSLSVDTARNETVSFNLDQYYSYSETTPTTGSTYLSTLEYYKNSTDNSTTKATIADDAIYVYNNTNVASRDYGKLFAKAAADDANAIVDFNGKTLQGGTVTLINNNADTKYDIVMVELASVAVVDEVNDDGIVFKNSAEGYEIKTAGADTISFTDVEVDAEDFTKMVSIVKDGKEVEYTELKEWDVLSVITSKEGADYIEIDVISNPITGSVTATKTSKTSHGGVAYKIDGKTYDVAAGAYGMDGIEVGDGGTFYIDKYGKIAALNEDSSLASGIAGKYAYVFEAKAIAGDFGDDVFSVQLVTEEGLQTLDLASSAKIKGSVNGGATTDSKTIKYANTPASNPDAKTLYIAASGTSDAPTLAAALKGSVVKFSKNGSGKISEIVLPGYQSAVGVDTKLENKRLVFDTDTDNDGTDDARSSEFDADNNKLGAFYGDKDAIVFFVDTDFDDCTVGTLADLTDKESYPVKAVLADNKADDNNVFVVSGSATKAGLTTNWAVITEVSEGTVDGNTIKTISYMTDGKLVENVDSIAWSDVDGTYDTISVGDIVKIKVNGAGKIAAVKNVVDFDLDNSSYAAITPATTNVGTSTETIDGGVVTKYAKNQNVATFASGKDFKLSKAENVYVVDTTGRDVTVKKGAASSYRFVEKLYATAAGGTATAGAAITVNGVAGTIGDYTSTIYTESTDKVYVREYDNRLTDVVIIKVDKPEIQ